MQRGRERKGLQETFCWLQFGLPALLLVPSCTLNFFAQVLASLKGQTSEQDTLESLSLPFSTAAAANHTINIFPSLLIRQEGREKEGADVFTFCLCLCMIGKLNYLCRCRFCRCLIDLPANHHHHHRRNRKSVVLVCSLSLLANSVWQIQSPSVKWVFSFSFPPFSPPLLLFVCLYIIKILSLRLFVFLRQKQKKGIVNANFSSAEDQSFEERRALFRTLPIENDNLCPVVIRAICVFLCSLLLPVPSFPASVLLIEDSNLDLFITFTHTHTHIIFVLLQWKSKGGCSATLCSLCSILM